MCKKLGRKGYLPTFASFRLFPCPQIFPLPSFCPHPLSTNLPSPSHFFPHSYVSLPASTPTPFSGNPFMQFLPSPLVCQSPPLLPSQQFLPPLPFLTILFHFHFSPHSLYVSLPLPYPLRPSQTISLSLFPNFSHSAPSLSPLLNFPLFWLPSLGATATDFCHLEWRATNSG